MAQSLDITWSGELRSRHGGLIRDPSSFNARLAFTLGKAAASWAQSNYAKAYYAIASPVVTEQILSVLCRCKEVIRASRALMTKQCRTLKIGRRIRAKIIPGVW